MFEDVLAHYASVFDADSLYGYRQIISIFSGVILIWMLGISYLLVKANPNGLENRFMAVLLICEGIKASWLLWDFFPNGPKFEWLWDYVWFFKIELYMFAIITSVILYLCFPVYYKVNKLKMLYNEKLQRKVWYMAPIIGLVIWTILRSQEGINIENSAWIICESTGKAPVLQSWFGEITEAMIKAKSDIGVCPSNFEVLITDEPIALTIIGFTQIPATILALILFRSAMKENENVKNNSSLTNRSLYIGLLGKFLIGMTYVLLLVIIFPLLNGGEMLTYADNISFQFGADRSNLQRAIFFLWTSSLAIIPISIGFEALMFVHASLKDSVFGIDKNLRETFRTAIFTGFGVVSFIVGCEVMEALIGFGMAGGVIVGLGVVVLRKPAYSLIDTFSKRIIPSEFSNSENKYIDAYKLAMADGLITNDERRLLILLAESYDLNQKRVDYIESFCDATMIEEE